MESFKIFYIVLALILFSILFIITYVKKFIIKLKHLKKYRRTEFNKFGGFFNVIFRYSFIKISPIILIWLIIPYFIGIGSDMQLSEKKQIDKVNIRIVITFVLMIVHVLLFNQNIQFPDVGTRDGIKLL